LYCYHHPQHLSSFPTRRSSDLTIAAADIMGASRLPLKNASASGNFVSLKRLYIIEEMIPLKIPINTFSSISLKASSTLDLSIPLKSATEPTDSNDVRTKKPVSPLSAAAP